MQIKLYSSKRAASEIKGADGLSAELWCRCHRAAAAATAAAITATGMCPRYTAAPGDQDRGAAEHRTGANLVAASQAITSGRLHFTAAAQE
jgi:hypothetical protein